MFLQTMPRCWTAYALASSLLLAVGGASAAESARPVSPELRAALMQAVGASDSFAHPFDAEVWLLDMAQRLAPFVPEREQRLEWLRLIHAEATRAGVPPEMVLAVIEVESRFERFALSHAGARGLMQVMPFWLEELGRPQDNLFDVATNLRYGCTILSHYYQRAEGRWHEALARYNGSFGKLWYPERVFKALDARWYAR
ncbi:MAG: lytic transglycosylase domain-containing protein [Algiphilus sp.]|nr:lytic transglycosylase domain-containing protein [Algiphilus sp.]